MQNIDFTEKSETFKEHEMEKTITQFGGTEVQKDQFHQYKKPISRENIDIYEIVVSDKVFFDKKDFKYFIGYKNTKK